MENRHFFIVGAQRSATTYLYHLCDEHPEIEMAKPIKPEPKFFLQDSLYNLGIDYYRKEYFPEVEKTTVLGEKSTSYMEVEKAARRISETFPSAKIIFLLRDPVARAVSNYWFSVNNGLETLPIEEAFRNEEERWQNYDASKVSVSPYAYLRRGRYTYYIDIYEKYFAADQIYIMIHEHLNNVGPVLQSLYSFLSVNQNFSPTVIHTRFNANENKPNTPLDPELENFMREYFEDWNARLAKKMGISLRELW